MATNLSWWMRNKKNKETLKLFVWLFQVWLVSKHFNIAKKKKKRKKRFRRNRPSSYFFRPDFLSPVTCVVICPALVCWSDSGLWRPRPSLLQIQAWSFSSPTPTWNTLLPAASTRHDGDSVRRQPLSWKRVVSEKQPWRTWKVLRLVIYSAFCPTLSSLVKS